MKKIMATIAIVLSALMLVGCSSKPEKETVTIDEIIAITEPPTVFTGTYDKNEVYNIVNAFIVNLKNQEYELAKQYYKDGQNMETLSFSSLVNNSSLGKALLEGNVSCIVQKYDEVANLVKVSFVYNDESHYFSIEPSDEGYKVIFNEEESINED